MPTFTAEELIRIGEVVFRAAGFPSDKAERVARSLAESDLVGHDSHGIIRIMPYLNYVRIGRLKPEAQVEVIEDRAASALLDAHWGVGQVAAEMAMNLAIEKARQGGVGMVGVRHCNHIGRVGEYSMLAALQGLIGIVACNVGEATVAAFGGTSRVLGTNPLSVAVPAGKRPAFWMDFATAACAEGKLKVARATNQAVPPGWILDKDGQPSTNALDFYDGGVILPWGGHKGYAICLLMDLLGGALTGHGCPSLPEWKGGNGVLAIAIDIEAFLPREAFEQTVERLFEKVKSGPTAEGVDEILIPGELEFRAREERAKNGVQIPETVWQQILGEARALGVEGELLAVAGTSA